MAAKTTTQPEAATYIAVRAFRSEAAANSGKRGRRLVINQADGTVSSLGAKWDPETRETTYEGMAQVSNLQAHSSEELAMALAASKTPLVLVDQALTEYVNGTGGQLPLEGLQGVGPDDFVDLREAAVTRRERIAEKAQKESAPKES